MAALTGAAVVAIAAVISYRLLPHAPAGAPADDADDLVFDEDELALVD